MSDNKKNREELKNYFRKGNVPTEEHFALLIDSVVNIVDDKPKFHLLAQALSSLLYSLLLEIHSPAYQ